MARPKADLPPAEALLALADADARLAVRVTPGAKTEGVAINRGEVQVRVRAKPQNGAANVAAIQLLAKSLGTAPSNIELLRGATSRQKVFRLF